MNPCSRCNIRFRVKDMKINTGGTLVAILNKKDAKSLDVRHEDRVKLNYKRKEVIVVLDISESRRAVPEGEIGLFEEVLSKLGVHQGDTIELELTTKPESVSYIRDKLSGRKLGYHELYSIVDDIVHDRLTMVEKTYFVSGTYTAGLDMGEIVHLTKAIVGTGQKLSFGKPVFDKHCIGGVPANRTSMIIVPIVAAAGLTMQKTSSRAITSPAGTADTMEVLANVTLSIPHLKRVVKRTRGCIVWGGAMNLAPADDKIIEVEHPLALDAEGQMLASVMAKKASVGATHVLIDIPYGKRAKCASVKEALHLEHLFRDVARRLGMKARVILTNGSQPVGKGIGPVLEARDVLHVLQNDPQAPRDLREKSLRMAGMILEMRGMKNGLEEARRILSSGEAWTKMHQIIRAQGEQEKHVNAGNFHLDVRSKNKGVVEDLNNEAINRIARAVGAPDDKGAGIYLEKKCGERVKKGETLFTIYSESDFKLKYGLDVMKKMWVCRVR